ncbi:hypothetical protein LTR41_011393 [Exophiala xenobiotica]|nr:hypothetical protein LTR41_011393 [Exophiala xenobiotica]KAK5550510.1 hypothetical protein LTR46_011490 [Exophiala xenobiotica]
MENGLVLRSPARPQFTVSEYEEYATKRRSQQEAYNQHDITAINHSTEHIFTHIHLPNQRRVDTSKITFRTSRNTQHTAPVRGKRVVPLSSTPLDGRWTSALRLPARPQFTVSEIEEYTAKKWS